MSERDGQRDEDLVAELQRELAEAARREEALRSKLLAYEALVNTIPALVFAKDRQHRYTFTNRGFASWYGREPADFESRTERDMFPAATAEMYWRHNEELMTSGGGLSGV